MPQKPSPEAQRQQQREELAENVLALPAMKGVQVRPGSEGQLLVGLGGKSVAVRVVKPEHLEAIAQQHAEAAGVSAQASGGTVIGAAGAYQNGTLYLCEDATLGEVGHEVVHAMQDAGLISQEEIDRFGGHEAMAYAYQEWVEGGRKKTESGVFERIADFILAMLGDRAAQARRRERAQESFLEHLDAGEVARRNPDRAWYRRGGLRPPLMPLDLFTDPAFGMRTLPSWLEGYQDRARSMMDLSAVEAMLRDGVLTQKEIDKYAKSPENSQHAQFADAYHRWMVSKYTRKRGTRAKNQTFEKALAYLAENSQYRAHTDEEIRQAVGAIENAGQIWATRPDLWAQAGERMPGAGIDDTEIDDYGPLTPNQDYLRSVDFDTFCPKNYQFYSYLNLIQKQLRETRPEAPTLSNEESSHLMLYMKARGLNTPCSYCYVENVRRAQRDALAEATRTKQAAFAYMDKHGVAPDVNAGTKDPHYAALAEMWYGDQRANRKAIAAGFLPKARKQGNIGKHERLVEWVNEWKADKAANRPHAYMGEDLFFDDEVRKQHWDDDRVRALHEAAWSFAKGAAHAKTVYGYREWDAQLLRMSPAQKEAINARAGMRMLSSTDFKVDHMIDWLQVVHDLDAEGWKAHLYTKSPELPAIVGNTGIKINMSIAFNGRDPSEFGAHGSEDVYHSMPWSHAREYRKQFPDAGTIMMAKNDEQIEWALDHPEVDMVIPFHRSGMRTQMIRALDWDDYEDVQHDEWDTEQFGSAAMARQRAAKVGYDGEKAPSFIAYDMKDGLPGHQNNKERYFALCARYGVKPRFSDLVLASHQAKMQAAGVFSDQDAARYEGRQKLLFAWRRWKNSGRKSGTAEDKQVFERIDAYMGEHPEAYLHNHPNYIKLIKDVARTDTAHNPVNAKGIDFDAAKTAMRNFQNTNGYQEDLKASPRVAKDFVDFYCSGQKRQLGEMTDRAQDDIRARHEDQMRQRRIDEEWAAKQAGRKPMPQLPILEQESVATPHPTKPAKSKTRASGGSALGLAAEAWGLGANLPASRTAASPEKASRVGVKLADFRTESLPDFAFHPAALIRGLVIEREHNDDPELAWEIVKYRLAEDPNYYDHLVDVESN